MSTGTQAAPTGAPDGISAAWRARRSPAGAALAAAALGWLFGLAGQLQQPVLWPLPAYVVATVLASGLLLAAAVLPWLRRPACLMLLGAVLAFASTGWRAEARLAQRLPAALEGQNLLVTGVIASLPQRGTSGTRFVLAVEQASLHGRAVQLPPRLALGWYRQYNDEDELMDPRSELRAGQRWRMPVRLKQPHGSLNPQGFDAELMWFEQGLGALGYVRVPRAGFGDAGQLRLLDEAAAYPVERLRQRLRDALLRELSDSRSAGVLAALVVGDQAAIERDDWELFRSTGIAHLVSISGVHVTMFAWLAALLTGWAWRRSPRLMLWLPAPTAGRWLGLALAAAYAMLAGWGVPAQRTVLMLALAVLLRGAGMRWPWPLVLLTTAAVVTATDPWALLQPGFWLSFTAVGLLMVSEPVAGAARAGPPDVAQGEPGARLYALLHGQLRGHLRAQVVATLGLAPLTLVFFQQISLVGFAANLVAIPLVTLLITPLALLGAVLPGGWALAAWLVQALVWGLELLARFPLAVWSAAAVPTWMAACALLGALLAMLPAPWALRWLALPLVLPMLWPPLARPDDGQFELVVADVGQGTAVLLRTRQHLLVYDTGPMYSRDSDAGQRVLLPLLRTRAEPAIDLLMLSHRDSDHVGGAASLLARHPVLALSSSLEAGHPLLAGGPAHQACRAGQHWQWDGVHFAVLHPSADDVTSARKPNAVSCVLRVEDAQGRSVLLTGDIESPQEAAMLRRDRSALASSLLLVPHHGSRTSSSQAFLEAVQPRTALVQAGYLSRFGHPAPDVVARYEALGIEIQRSDRCGAWLWHSGRASCTRDVQRRYWHWQAPGGGANVARQVNQVNPGDKNP